VKWPATINWIRHAESGYNVLRERKQQDPLYAEFLRAFEADSGSKQTIGLAQEVWERFRLEYGDYDTPITERGESQARALGLALPNEIEMPDTIILSPHKRACATLECIIESWPDLRDVARVEEPRLREHEHGLALIYNDWRVYHVMEPKQRMLYEIGGPYWYRYPQGENTPDVIERVRSFIGTIVRDYSERRVLIVSHHLTLLSFMAAIQRWDCATFTKWNEEQKPINCGLTIFRGNPHVGSEGRLELLEYNKKLY